MFTHFDNDIQLMFSNCFTYNAPSSMVSKMALGIKAAWDNDKMSFMQALYAPETSEPSIAAVSVAPKEEKDVIKLDSSAKESKHVESTSTDGVFSDGVLSDRKHGTNSATSTKENSTQPLASGPIYSISSSFSLSTDIPAGSESMRLRWALCLFHEEPFIQLLKLRFFDVLDNILSQSIESTEAFHFYDVYNLRLLLQLMDTVWKKSSGTLPVDVVFLRTILPKFLVHLLENVNDAGFDIGEFATRFATKEKILAHHEEFLTELYKRLNNTLRRLSVTKK